MEQIRFFSSFCLILSLAPLSTEAYPENESQARDPGKVKLFVFGDSYADTGNLPSSIAKSWKPPYGITYPGKPSGRFSDGRVLTDYIASFLGIKSPLPYGFKNFNTETIQHGINFAHGGSGVFRTFFDIPKMSTQIDFFQQLIHKNVCTTQDLNSSIALVSLAGNDYTAYAAKNGKLEDMRKFSRSLISELMVNVRRINGLGIKKIAITGLEPAGCLPKNTASASYENCNAARNNFSVAHNQLLQQNILALNHEAAAPVYRYLDLYTAFISALKKEQNPRGNLSDKLKPCCFGANSEDSCGLVDNYGKNRYVLCENPEQSFFWDSEHPSNAGWEAVYSALNPSLQSVLL